MNTIKPFTVASGKRSSLQLSHLSSEKVIVVNEDRHQSCGLRFSTSNPISVVAMLEFSWLTSGDWRRPHTNQMALKT
jgi:hypothetical protein